MKSNKNNKRKSRSKKRKISVSDLVTTAVNEQEAGGDNTADMKRANSRVTRLNQRFVLLVAVCSLLLAAGMHGVRNFQLNRNAEIYLKRATSLQEEGKSSEAIIYLSRYLRFQPDDVDALEKRGDLVSETSNSLAAWQHVYFTYEEVLRLDSSRSDVRRKLVDVSVKLGRYSTALSHIKNLVEDVSQNFSKDGELSFLSAVCHEAVGNHKSAIDAYFKSIDLSPGENDHYLGFALYVSREADALPLRRIHEFLFALSDMQPEADSSKDETSETEKEPILKPEGEKIVDLILDVMVLQGQPAYEARLTRAKFRSALKTSFSDFPLPDEPAAKRAATAVLSNLDSNADGVLDHTEWVAAPFVPSIVDLNEDHIINEDELKKRYLRGAELARLEHARRDIEKCLEMVDRAGKSEVLLTAAQIRMALSRASRQEGKADDGDAHLQQTRQYALEGLDQKPLDLRFYLVLSNIAILEGDLDQAENHVRDALKKISQAPKEEQSKEFVNPENIKQDIKWALADILFSKQESKTTGAESEELAEAKNLIQSLSENNLLEPRVKYLNGRMLFSQQQWHQASLKLEEVRRELEDNTALRRRIDLLLGICYERLGNPDAKIKVFRRALQIDPLWVNGRIRLGASLAALNRIDEALEEYRIVGGVPGIPTVVAALVLRRELSLPEDRRSSGFVLVEDALNVEDELSSKRNQTPPVSTALLRANLMLIRKKWDEADQFLHQLSSDNPEDPQVWSALSKVSLFREDLEESERISGAEQILNQAREKIGNPVELRLAAIQIAAAKPPEETRKEFLEFEKDLEDLEQLEQIQVLEALAREYARLSIEGKPFAMWDRIAQRQSKTLPPLLVLAELSQNDKQKYNGILEDIRKIEGNDGPNGNYLEAKQLIRGVREALKSGKTMSSSSQDLERARTLLGRAEKQRPFWPSVSHLMGNLESLGENRDAAIEHYRQAIAKGSRSRQVIGQLVQFLYEKQKFEEADQVLRQLSNEDPSLVSGNLASLASVVAWQLKQFDDALSLVARSAEESEDVRTKILYGQMRFARGQRGKEVEDIFKEAVQAAVSQKSNLIPAAYFSLVNYYSRVKKLDDADSVIQDAKQHLPEEPVYLAPLTLARFYESLHLPERTDRKYLQSAEEQYLAALNTKPDEIGLKINVIDFYTRAKEIQKANEHLERILASKSDVSETVRAWANRRRALLTAAGGTYSDTVDALKLLSFKGKKKNEVATSDLRTKAAILSKRPFKQDRLELIRVLEEIATRQKLTSAEQLQLAQLYESTGDWTKSRKTMRSLLNDEPSNPVLLALYVRALLRHQDPEESALTEAESLVDRLESLEPDTFRTKTTQARLLAAQNRGSEAAKLLKDFVKGRLVAPVEQTLRDLLESEKAEESLATIEKLFEDSEDQRISAVFAQARDLLQQNKRKEAIGILKKIVLAQDVFAELQIESMRSAAALLEKLGETKTAEEMYRDYVSRSRRPETVVSLISFLGRQKRFQQAIDLCEKSWNKVSTEVLASVAMATIREGKLPNRNVQRLEQQLETGLKKDPNSASLLLVLAELRDYQGRYDQVELLYRRMLAKNRNNVVALNNLAWILALQRRNSSEALQLMDRAIGISGPASELLDTQAVVFLAANKPLEAEKVLTTAIDQAPSGPKYFHLAQVQFRKKDYSATRQSLQQAKQAGLLWDTLHPLERPEFNKMAKELARR